MSATWSHRPRTAAVVLAAGADDASRALLTSPLGETNVAAAALATVRAVVPAERNYLINPRHPDFARIVIGVPKALDVDVRLLRNLGGAS